MSYTRMYVNRSFFRLYRGFKRKTSSDDSRVMEMRYWEVGVGRWAITIGRWAK